jgi:xanthine dehydrogenase YagR molybdenum-binding subunit
MSETVVGKPIDRVDGKAKVTGQAKYAAEFSFPEMAYAVPVQSSISKGRIKLIDTSEAETLPGVLAILTHKNSPRLKIPERSGGGMAGEKIAPLQGDTVHYNGQDVALVIADRFERARAAAMRIKITYELQPAKFDMAALTGESPELPPEHYGKKLQVQRGKAADAFEKAEVKIEETYSTPIENHNPMEPSASVANWDGESLTVHDATQAIVGSRKVLSEVFGIPLEHVRVICPYVGGAFGCKGSTWPHVFLACMASKHVKRPVQLARPRQQMFTSVGRRPKTVQKIALAADAGGKLTAVRHITTHENSRVSDFIEPCGLATSVLYSTPNFEMEHRIHRLDVNSATFMRAPGEASGTFAIESAMDELAYKLKLDPLELRLRNHADEDPQENKPWSSKHLKECYRNAADAFGWDKRIAEPRSMRDGRFLIGWGMATAIYPGNRSDASARARMLLDGSLVVSSATQDLGTGTYTIMTQIAADAMGVPVESVRFELGDSQLPSAPVSGGSQTAASVGPAVQKAVELLRAKLLELAVASPESPLKGKTEDQIEFGNSRLYVKGEESRGESYKDILRRAKLPSIEAIASAAVATKDQLTKEASQNVSYAGDSANADKEKHSFYSFGSHFVEVRVDPDLGTIRVGRVVSAFDVGRVLNLKTARSQALGGVVMGIGMALLEETVRDPKTGRIVTRNLADYRVPVNADVPGIEVLFVNIPDPFISVNGARGIGEIGITGISAAIANAVYHATGKRVRDLPITPEKIL